MIQHIHKVKKGIEAGNQLLLNPVDMALEWLVRIVLHMLIPIPLAAEAIVQFKGTILLFLLNGIVVAVALGILLVGVITHPVSAMVAASSLTVPNDGSFVSTDIPLQNPLGGQGLSLVIITAGFMDPSYLFFGGVHTGVDFVPNSTYYQVSPTYKQMGDVVVYATLNGTVDYYVDQYGSHTVEITNDEQTMKSIDMHLNKVFVTTSQKVTAGTPIGTMGDTGFATGEHLHYELRVNNGGVWTPVNPLGYIH